MITNIPTSIGIIMDGNRRYAKAKGISSLLGHRQGYLKLREVNTWAREAGVKEMIVYAFSTENWNRSADEVSYLMDLFRELIQEMVREALRDDVRIIFLGDRGRLAKDIQRAMSDAEDATKGCQSFKFGVALSYGGRTEILDAIKRIPEEDRSTITEEEFSRLLWTRELSDPDLIIRTSGEERISNFLPWQSVYSEFVFTKTLWPDFSKKEFMEILGNFAERKRRRGK